MVFKVYIHFEGNPIQGDSLGSILISTPELCGPGIWKMDLVYEKYAYNRQPMCVIKPASQFVILNRFLARETPLEIDGCYFFPYREEAGCPVKIHSSGNQPPGRKTLELFIDTVRLLYG